LEVSGSRAGHLRRSKAIVRGSTGSLRWSATTPAKFAAPQAIQARLRLGRRWPSPSGAAFLYPAGCRLPAASACSPTRRRLAPLRLRVSTPGGVRTGPATRGRWLCSLSAANAPGPFPLCKSTGEPLMSNRSTHPFFIGTGLHVAGGAAGSLLYDVSFRSDTPPADFSPSPSRAPSKPRRPSSAFLANLHGVDQREPRRGSLLLTGDVTEGFSAPRHENPSAPPNAAAARTAPPPRLNVRRCAYRTRETGGVGCVRHAAADAPGPFSTPQIHG